MLLQGFLDRGLSGKQLLEALQHVRRAQQASFLDGLRVVTQLLEAVDHLEPTERLGAMQEAQDELVLNKDYHEAMHRQVLRRSLKKVPE